jgi:hypothetical protein
MRGGAKLAMEIAPLLFSTSSSARAAGRSLAGLSVVDRQSVGLRLRFFEFGVVDKRRLAGASYTW